MTYIIIEKLINGEDSSSAYVDIESIVLKKVQYTTAERDALSPVEGDEIYNITVHAPQYYNGTMWV